jgi:hypothetical protein
LFIVIMTNDNVASAGEIRVFEWSDVIDAAQTNLCPSGLALCSARENLTLSEPMFNETLLSPNHMSPGT